MGMVFRLFLVIAITLSGLPGVTAPAPSQPWPHAPISVNGQVYVYDANGRRVALRAAGVTYIHGDHLRSTSFTSGAQSGNIKYFPYGATRSGAVSMAYKFTGQRLDDSTGLYYYGARYYDPALGRFVQADTLVPNPGNPQDLNRYSYGRNNPLTYIDDGGRFPIIPILIVGGIVALKAIDYGWTAYDAWQSLRVMNDPNTSEAAKAEAAANLAMTAAFEAIELDDILPVALPLDDLARKGVLKLGKEAGQEAAERAGKEAAEEALEWAIKSEIRPARELLAKSVPDTEVHHLIEQRFARDVFGLDPSDMPAIRLDKTFHQQKVTARLFSELPTNPRRSFTAQDVWNAYQRVYGPDGLNRLDWLEAIWPYFEKLGVTR